MRLAMPPIEAIDPTTWVSPYPPGAFNEPPLDLETLFAEVDPAERVLDRPDISSQIDEIAETVSIEELEAIFADKLPGQSSRESQ